MANCGQWSDGVIHDIKFNNNKVPSTAMGLKFTGLLKCFGFTMFLKRAECTQRLYTRPNFINQRFFASVLCIY